jgi:hypothetical protein
MIVAHNNQTTAGLLLDRFQCLSNTKCVLICYRLAPKSLHYFLALFGVHQRVKTSILVSTGTPVVFVSVTYGNISHPNTNEP